MKNLLGNLRVKDIIKEFKSLDIRDNANHERILILLYILNDIDKTKNRCLYSFCRTIDEAIECWKSANNFANTIRNSCGL